LKAVPYLRGKGGMITRFQVLLGERSLYSHRGKAEIRAVEGRPYKGRKKHGGGEIKMVYLYQINQSRPEEKLKAELRRKKEAKGPILECEGNRKKDL